MSAVVLDTITADDVRRSVTSARAGLEQAAGEVVWQIEHETWTLLGYPDWESMREAEYGGAAFMVPTGSRPRLVQRLRALGMTQRAIARTAGVSQKTVSNDLASKTTQPPRRRPARGGGTNWSRRVQNVSAKCPMDDLTTEQVEELLGAATFLRDYCKGELIRRKS